MELQNEKSHRLDAEFKAGVAEVKALEAWELVEATKAHAREVQKVVEDAEDKKREAGKWLRIGSNSSNRISSTKPPSCSRARLGGSTCHSYDGIFINTS